MLIDIIVSLIEKLGLLFWKRHESTEQQANMPLTNDEENADIDKLP